ncbi:hypothetical protein [Mucilaginibacter phyllosphaerae]|uniref:hypothetical protein n=1 Tax=Mucilaginibacter phyllosphaerae TaxID=1812349 RepID=UPI001067B9DE|nr:hypothetical protein [Mucilaginibacter phyllosphaerae]
MNKSSLAITRLKAIFLCKISDKRYLLFSFINWDHPGSPPLAHLDWKGAGLNPLYLLPKDAAAIPAAFPCPPIRLIHLLCCIPSPDSGPRCKSLPAVCPIRFAE